jgi:hypothetical protein
MSDDTDNSSNEKVKWLADKFVELGYASAAVSYDSRGFTDVAWTPKGASLRAEVQKIHDALAKDRGDIGRINMLLFLSMFIGADGPEPPHHS